MDPTHSSTIYTLLHAFNYGHFNFNTFYIDSPVTCIFGINSPPFGNLLRCMEHQVIIVKNATLKHLSMDYGMGISH